MTKAVKVSAALTALCLAACPDASMATDDDGPGMPQMGDPMDDPRDDPYLADINNAWGGPLADDFYGFTFFANPSGKISSAVVSGTGNSKGGSLQVDGVFHDHNVDLTVMQGTNVWMFDGVFVDIETMDLTIQETQARISLFCSTIGGACK